LTHPEPSTEKKFQFSLVAWSVIGFCGGAMTAETPETDKLFAPLWAKDDPPTDEELHEVTKSFRQMERQRDEARREATDYRNADAETHGVEPTPLPWENA
jgi:hypothetical protein